ncbi:MAG: dihydropteroate synthase [Candidatus Omnitrophica bacterium]|nr:dihydropteroate synthase [Candidatus Omnitrophota bacterium]
MFRILQISNQQDLKQIMRDIRVDPYGIKIMLPKADTYLIKMNSISNITANILKQEMLSLGGDVAIARDALTGKTKNTDCLIIGNLSQLTRLNHKLNKQPFGLNRLGQDLFRGIRNYQRNGFILEAGRYKLNLGRRSYVMGIINLTPDSFSGDGLYRIRDTANHRVQPGDIIDAAEKMVNDGADILDAGGESTRPGARPVSIKEELKRTIPLIKLLAKKIKIPISIDTHKPEVARQALDNGASMVNDISGLRNPEMAKIIAKYKAAVVIMHMKGTPGTMQQNPQYSFLIEEIIGHLAKAIEKAESFGISKEKIIIDPGLGFGKLLTHNLEILRRLAEFKVLGVPILVGPSRKSFIGNILNSLPQERTLGTVSACVLAVRNGAKLVRVHDVKEVKQALKVLDAIEKI